MKKKNVSEKVFSVRHDNIDTIRALGEGRVMESEKYLAFNPFVGGTPTSACWLVSKKEGGLWRRLVAEGRDMLLTAAEARDLAWVGV